MITDSGNGFYNWNGNLYHSDIVRSCIRPLARAVGKSTPQHIRRDATGLKINPEVYLKFLLADPNPYMTGQVLLEKLITQLELNNNAFIYINRDTNGLPNELYNIAATGCEAVYDKLGLLYLKFHMNNGKIVTYPYEDVIHIRQDCNENDIFGESPVKTLKSLMEIVNTTDQGIVKAVKNSSAIKWLLKFNTPLKDDALTQATKKFTENFLSIDKNHGGAAATDAKYDAKQVDPKDFVPNAPQLERSTQRLYSFFGTNEKITQSKYDEDEWNAYYESRVEPILLQLSNEFTRKIFSRRERGFGNQIIFSATSLQYASMTTKLNLEKMVDRGSMTPNEWREIMNLPPIEGGDQAIRRLDTAVVNGNSKGGDE